ncbi:MAG TPA: VOC family protein [Nannocystaceae bacterium]|nr:VOC family protein [Nannocystaceae bacterium]
MQGAFVHLELHTDDTSLAKAFYQDLFGWSYNDVPQGDALYTMIASPQQPGAGMQHKGMPDAPTMWLPYVTVDSVHDTVSRARTAGAEIIVEYMEAPGFGAGAILRDPTGAAFGIWKAEAPPADAPAPAAKTSSKKKASKPAAKKAAKKPAKPAAKKAAKKPAPKKPAAKKAAKPAKPAAKKAGKKGAKR